MERWTSVSNWHQKRTTAHSPEEQTTPTTPPYTMIRENGRGTPPPCHRRTGKKGTLRHPNVVVEGAQQLAGRVGPPLGGGRAPLDRRHGFHGRAHHRRRHGNGQWEREKHVAGGAVVAACGLPCSGCGLRVGGGTGKMSVERRGGGVWGAAGCATASGRRYSTVSLAALMCAHRPPPRSPPPRVDAWDPVGYGTGATARAWPPAPSAHAPRAAATIGRRPASRGSLAAHANDVFSPLGRRGAGPPLSGQRMEGAGADAAAVGQRVGAARPRLGALHRELGLADSEGHSKEANRKQWKAVIGPPDRDIAFHTLF